MSCMERGCYSNMACIGKVATASNEVNREKGCYSNMACIGKVATARDVVNREKGCYSNMAWFPLKLH